jgi:hypothetical protein
MLRTRGLRKRRRNDGGRILARAHGGELNTGYDYGILLLRNQHGGIVEDVVRGRTVKRYRSSPDARLFQAMDGEQERAFHQIGDAFGILTAGLNVQAMDLSRVRGKGHDDFGAELIAQYAAWRKNCARKRLKALLALEIIVFGHSLRQVEIGHRLGHGAAKKNLMKCLDVW